MKTINLRPSKRTESCHEQTHLSPSTPNQHPNMRLFFPQPQIEILHCLRIRKFCTPLLLFSPFSTSSFSSSSDKHHPDGNRPKSDPDAPIQADGGSCSGTLRDTMLLSLSEGCWRNEATVPPAHPVENADSGMSGCLVADIVPLTEVAWGALLPFVVLPSFSGAFLPNNLPQEENVLIFVDAIRGRPHPPTCVCAAETAWCGTSRWRAEFVWWN